MLLTIFSEVENYVKWLLVYKYLPLLDSRLKGLYDSFNTLLTGNGAKPRYETCTAIVTSRMQYTVSRLYTQSNIQGGTRNKVWWIELGLVGRNRVGG